MKLFLSLVLITNLTAMSQNTEVLPYYQIPTDYSEYTAGTVAARMVDGLGFRFRWATEDLKTEDLVYKLSEEARTIEQTIDHILGLSRVLVNAALKKQNGGDRDLTELTYRDKRKEALVNMEKASSILQKATNLNEFNILFGSKEFPFWNAINGPIEDAVWHSGQIVAMRRAAGNPLPAGVNFMTGTIKKQ
jgi:uncharacterized damage-inducible protein DinB